MNSAICKDKLGSKVTTIIPNTNRRIIIFCQALTLTVFLSLISQKPKKVIEMISKSLRIIVTSETNLKECL